MMWCWLLQDNGAKYITKKFGILVVWWHIMIPPAAWLLLFDQRNISIFGSIYERFDCDSYHLKGKVAKTNCAYYSVLVIIIPSAAHFCKWYALYIVCVWSWYSNIHVTAGWIPLTAITRLFIHQLAVHIFTDIKIKYINYRSHEL